MELYTGDAILVHDMDVIDELIEWGERGKYSHVAIYAWGGWVLEAQGGRKIGYRRLSEYEGHYDVGRVRKWNQSNSALALVYALKRVGNGYGWKLFFFTMLKVLFGIDRPYKKAWGEVCSKYFCNSWLYGGVDLCPGNDKPTPQDIADSSEVELFLASEPSPPVV